MSKWSEKLKSLARLMRYFKKGNENSDSTESLNTFMKNKQTIWGLVALSIMLIIVLILHGLATKEPKRSIRKVSHQVKLSDGILTADFTEKDNLSALESQQQQIDYLNHHIEHLSKLTEKLAQENKKSSQHDLKSKLNKVKQPNNDVLPVNPIVGLVGASLKNKVQSNHFKQYNAVDEPIGIRSQVDRFNRHRVKDINPEISTYNFRYTKPVAYHHTPSRFYPKASSQHRSLSNKNSKNYVPAGTFVRGVLLEGADANASVNGQSDTVPILVRLLDQGTLPNGGVSHLKGCFVLASIFGDISSERGEARLDKLSCTRKDGTILEVSVQGHLSFAGKEGIKGKPIMRNGKILTMAGISGALSGFGSALQQTMQTVSTSGAGTVTSVSGNQIWKNGAYGGASTAMGQLAHYYIQRANQYHPIISIGSGTVATVIFQRGFSLVDKHGQQKSSDVASKPLDSEDTNLAEVKSLIQKAQQTAKQHSEPFTNLSNLTLGQRIRRSDG